MSRLVLGVVGHVDHGKTALVRALTGMETDRLPDERRRGMSIELGFAHAELGGTVDFVDAPGHERFVRAMVAGVTGADAVLVVVAANEGVKPQTREHLTIASLLGVKTAVLAVTKADLVAPEAADRVAAETARLARGLGVPLSAVIAVSATTGVGIDDLKAAIARLTAQHPEPPDDGFAYLPVDRAFAVRGQGVVVTGTLRRGRLTPDTLLDLHPAGRRLHIRAMQAHGAPVTHARPGQRLAVNLRGADLDELERGCVLADADAIAPSTWLSVVLSAAPDAPILANNATLELLVGARRSPARVRLLDRDQLAPGDRAMAQLRLPGPLAAPAGDGFVLRRPSPAATVAGGRVVDPEARRLRRGRTPALARLERLAAAAPSHRLRVALDDAGLAGISLVRLARLSGLAADRAARDATAVGGVRLKGDVYLAAPAFTRAQAMVLRCLSDASAPMPLGELGACLSPAGPQVVAGTLAVLQAGGRVRIENGRVALHRPEAAQAQARATAAAAAMIAERLRVGGFSPPDTHEETATPVGRRALQRLVGEGVAVRTYDRVQKREVLFHRDAVEAARRRLAPQLSPPGLSISDIGRILGTSRKFSVPLMEHLDAVRFTRRIGDRRISAQAAAAVETAYGGD